VFSTNASVGVARWVRGLSPASGLIPKLKETNSGG